MIVQQSVVKKVLYHPLTWLAVGVHIALLFVPFSPTSPSVAQSEAPEEEADESIPVDILNLADISAPTPPADVPPPATSPPPAAAPPTAPPPTAAPAPAPAAPEQPAPAPTPAVPAETPAAAPIEASSPPPPPAYDPSGDQQVFVGHIDAIGIKNYRDQLGLPGANTFPKGNGATFLDFANPAMPAPTAGARDAVWMDKQPLDVLAKLKETYEPAGVTFTQLDSYGGELLYQLINPDGQPFMHVSLVDFATGSSLLVMWSDSPL